HEEIDAHETRIDGSSLKTKQRLRKNLFLREAAQDLVEKTYLDFACRKFIRLAAAFALAAQRFRLVEMHQRGRDVVTQSAGEQRFAEMREIVLPAEFVRDGGGVAEIGRFHQFEVLLVL